MRKLRVAIAMGASAGALACALLAGIKERTTGPADAGPLDSGAPTCTHPRWPNPPDVQPSVNTNDYNVAARTFDFGFEVEGAGDAGAVAVFGYDLDCVDTCDPGPESCRPHHNAAKHCDEPAGVDNYTANLLQQVAGLIPGAPSANDFSMNAHIASGDRGFLIQISEYNGAADSTGLVVTVYASSGIRRARDGGVGEGGAAFPPLWDGQDDWALDPSSVSNPDAGGLGGAPLFFDTNPYVTGGVLVAHFDKIAVPASIGVGTGVFIVEDVTLTANVVATDAGGANFALTNGLIGARIRTSTVLSGLAQFADPYTQAALCGSDVSYGIAKPLICGLADINATSAHDNLGYGCNALSVAVRFEADPTATSNYVASVPDAGEPGCSDAGTFYDDCDADNGDY